MFIYINFVDGSNPYVRLNMDEKELEKEKKKWERNFNLEKLKVINEGVFYEAVEKRKGGYI